MADKRTEQINGKLTPEMKREALEFCRAHGITESELVNTAMITYFEMYNAFGPVKLMAMIQEVLH